MHTTERQIEKIEVLMYKYEEIVKQKKSVIKIILISIVLWLAAAILWLKKDKRFSIISSMITGMQIGKLVFWMKSTEKSSRIIHDLNKIRQEKEDELEYIDEMYE